MKGTEGLRQSAGKILGPKQDSELLIFLETSSFIISKVLLVAQIKLLFPGFS